MKRLILKKAFLVPVIALMLLSAVNLKAADAEKNLNFKGTVNINTASEEELQLLFNIGPVKAKRIIKYRETYNGFKELEELKHVKGIGDRTYEVIKNHVSLTGVTVTF